MLVEKGLVATSILVGYPSAGGPAGAQDHFADAVREDDPNLFTTILPLLARVGRMTGARGRTELTSPSSAVGYAGAPRARV